MPIKQSTKLASKECREENKHRLPREVKKGLMKIARQENKTMSWVLEEVIIRYFHLREPEYIHPKNDSQFKFKGNGRK